MDLNETTLREWYLITFTDASEPNRILWGTVADDPSGRWGKGNWCCTSPLLDQTSDQVFITKNTRYTLQGPGEHVELPVNVLIELRQGFSPDQVHLVIDNRDLSLAFARQVIESQLDIENGRVEPYCFDESPTELSPEEQEHLHDALSDPPKAPAKLKQLMELELFNMRKQ